MTMPMKMKPTMTRALTTRTDFGPGRIVRGSNRRAVKVRLYPEPCDMRRSFDGLAALVRDHLGLDPSSEDQYLFANRRRNRLKVLCRDDSGLIVVAKRADNGNFAIDSPRVRISASELQDLLSGTATPQNGRRKHRGHA